MAPTAPDWPRLMRRSTAALYCDMTAPDFEHQVIAGHLPQPVMLGGKEHWSRVQIDEAIDRMTGAKLDDWRDDAPIYKNRAA